MKKNVASQRVGAQLVNATTGAAFTGAVTVSVTGDAGTQATGSVGSGACTHEGNGYHTYAPAQAETNYDLVAFTFTGTGAVPVTVQVYTSFPQSADGATLAQVDEALDDVRGNLESHPKVLKQSESTSGRRRVYFRVPLQGGGEGTATGSVSARVSKNGAALAASAGTVGRLALDSSRAFFYYEFTAGELSDLGVVSLELQVAGTGNPVANVLHFQVVAYDPYTVAVGALTPTVAGRTLDVTATGAAGVDWANVENPTTTVALTGTTVDLVANAVDATAIATGAITSAKVATGAITSATFAAGAINAAALAADAITAAKVAADVTTEITAGLATATNVTASTAAIAALLPVALVDGRIDASVGAMAAGVVTAAAVATGAIDADALATDAVTEIQTGLATSAALATAQADLTRLLGLHNENARIDNTTYTSGKCTAMRIRVFASAAAANASTSGAADNADSEVARYTVAASYTGDELDTYKMVRAL